ncbi:DHS-like NAD/FAD-binding domain-containing protein [Xylariaceae sp. FL1019]|nr:DHS-like NAD/FAD-binding domain-containing protein [Xylariaceae sp. FL1019]
MDASPSSSPLSDLSDPPSSNPPSSPLSVLTRSPSISPRASLSLHQNRLPSPPSSTIYSSSASPAKSSDLAELEIHVNPDGPPPAKRRRVERKPRTTQTIDLTAGYRQSAADDELIHQLTRALRKKKKIVVIAGAGISVSAGIPDFRSSSGLFATLPKEYKLKGSGKDLFDASVYKHDASTSDFHDMVRQLSNLVSNAQPTPFHHFLASLATEGRLLRLYTQNVDGLDTSMDPLGTAVPLPPKGPWPQTIQLHGCLAKMVCSKCHEISQFDASLFEGPQAPLCKGCEETDNVRTSHAGKRSHGIGRLRPRMVLYNEYNPDQESIDNVVRADIRSRPDAIVVVGTTLKIPGVKNMVKDMCKKTRERRDGITMWINLEPEPSGELKNCWDLIVRGKCDDVASLVQLPHFDESIEQGVETIVDDAKYESDVRRAKVEVEIRSTASESGEESGQLSSVEAKLQSIEKVQGFPTPSASPKIRTALPTKPRSKAKQTRISFAGHTTSSASTKVADVIKKTTQNRKKHTKKPEAKPKATINTAFKMSKTNIPATSKTISTKRPLDLGASSSDEARELCNSDFSLRPRRPKPAPDSFVSQKIAEYPIKQELPDTRPITPEQKQPSPSMHHTTVSPPSKPRGMGSLID